MTERKKKGKKEHPTRREKNRKSTIKPGLRKMQ